MQETIQQELLELIGTRNWVAVREALSPWHAPEVADLLPELEKPDRVLVFRLLPRDLASEVFSYLSTERQDELLRDLTDEETREVLANLTPDDRTHLFEELPARVTKRLVNLLSPEDRREVTALLGYPEESVGRLMTPEYVAVRSFWTVARAFEQIREFGRDSETINRIYVIDSEGKLLDDIEVRKFLLARPETPVSELMTHSFVSISALADREEAVASIRRYGLLALPVVDSQGVLLGIVTFDDLLAVQEEEVTEDFHKVGSVEPLRTSLLETGIATLYRSRIGWLLGLVFINVFSGAGIAYFEDTIAATVALVFFLPLLIGSAGNAGAQAATLTIRAMATGEAVMHDWLELFLKEIQVALLMGLTMAAAVAGLGMIRGGADVALVVSLTMVVVVLCGSLVGLTLPFLLQRFGFDPATASAPLVTSIADISGVLIYFSIASWYLARS